MSVLLLGVISAALPADIGLPRLSVPRLLPSQRADPLVTETNRFLLAQVEWLIKDVEGTIKDLEALRLDAKLIGDYRAELKGLYTLRDKLRNKMDK